MAITTFDELWDATTHTHANRMFLLFRSSDGAVQQWTYAEFDTVVGRTAARLESLGVGAGDGVHLVLRNSPAFVALWLAVARLGAWMVPADPLSVASDITGQVRRIRPKVGFCAASRAQAYREGAGADVPLVVELTETAADIEAGGALDGPGCVAAGATHGPADRLAVMFTSGTTSEPKGVVLTQANYVTVAEKMSGAADLDCDHRWYVTLPLFHANAQYYCFASAIYAGGSVALTAGFSASGWIRQALELGVTHASLFAAPIRMILDRTPEGTPPLALQHVWFAQNLASEHYERFAALTGTRPRQLYGMTETVAVVCADNRPPYSNDVIGSPVADRDIRIRAMDSGAPPVPREPGVLEVWGVPGVDLFAGYLEDPDATARVLTVEGGGAWFNTGDLVTVGSDGQMRFAGRVDDVIKVAGENVSLGEVEAKLARAPGVSEAAVVARRDAMRDVVPVAYVTPRDTADPPEPEQLREWAVENLAPSARPAEWHVIPELPRTSVGKVRKSHIGRG